MLQNKQKNWFGYKNTRVKIRMKDGVVKVLTFYPILSGIINVVMLFGLIYYLLLKGWKNNEIFKKTIIMAAAVWLINAVFTILASSAALRFQSFPIILTTTFTLLLADWMAQLIRKMRLEQNQQQVVAEGYGGEAIA